MRPLHVPPLSNEVSTEPNPKADKRLIDTLTLTGRMTLNHQTQVQVKQQLQDDLAAQAGAIQQQKQAHQALIAQLTVPPLSRGPRAFPVRLTTDS